MALPIQTEGRLRYFAAQNAAIVFRTPFAAFKVARLSFGKDGSIYLQFPYLRGKNGFLAELPPTDIPGPITYSLGEIGMKVSTDVKFSHHTSGVVQLGKTGQEIRGPRRWSFPLTGPIGKIFELHAYWLSGFELLTKPSKRAINLGFDFPDDHPAAVVIRAEWRRKSDIQNNVFGAGFVGPATTAQHQVTKHIESVYFVGQPPGYPLQDHVLMISGGEVSLPKGVKHSSMVFLGGWDPHEQLPGEPTKRVSACLCFYYSDAIQSAGEGAKF